MPVVLPAEYRTPIERPQQPDPFYWLWEIVLDEPLTEPPTEPVWTRLVAAPEDVNWPPGSEDVYAACNMTQSEIETDGEGNLPTLKLGIDNTGRWLMPYLEQIELEGNRASVTLINRALLSLAQPARTFDFEIAGAQATRQTVELTLEFPNFFERLVPAERYSASHCRWKRFGGVECGYVINSSAGFTICPRTIPACVARGLDEQSRGLAVLHPRRYGGFPGIPVQRIG